MALLILAATGLATAKVPSEGIAPHVIAMSFGIYDSQGDLGTLMSEGWTLASAAELNEVLRAHARAAPLPELLPCHPLLTTRRGVSCLARI